MSLKRTCGLLLTGLAGLLLPQETVAINLRRDALWHVVQTCIAAKQVLNISLPCLQVDLESPGSPGAIVIRSPWSETHTLVVPTERLVGIEADALRQPEGAVYWRAALAARKYVVEAAQNRVRIQDVGLAINSKGSRTQDQLHIHVDCARPEVLSKLRQYDAEIGNHWSLLSFLHTRPRFYGIKVKWDKADAPNIFDLLMHLPGQRKDLAKVAVAVFSSAPDAAQQNYYIVASEWRGSQAEDLLDHSCSLAQGFSGDEVRARTIPADTIR